MAKFTISDMHILNNETNTSLKKAKNFTGIFEIKRSIAAQS